MLAGAPRVAAGSTFAPVLARLESSAETLFGGAIRRFETGRAIEGPSARLLPVRIHTSSASVDLFVKRFVPAGDVPEAFERAARYIQWESERTLQAAAIFRSSPALGVSRVVASFPDLLALVTERCPGTGLDRVLRRLAIVRSGKAMNRAVAAFSRVGEWLRRFQAGVPVRNPAIRKDYREYLDIRLRALAASARSGFTDDHRRTLLHVFETVRRQVDAADLALVATHADLCPANVLVRDGGVTVVDFAMSSDGNRYVDLAHLALHLRLLGRRWRLGSVVNRLERALLEGYNPDLGADAPLLKLMMVQHSACYLAGGAAKARGWMDERVLRGRVAWALRMFTQL